MKRKTLLLMMLLALFSAGAWAQSAYYSYSNITSSYSGATLYSNGTPANLLDNSLSTKYCPQYRDDTWPTYSRVDFESNDLIIPTGYVIYTGDDTQQYPDRNPKNWTIQAKVNSSDSWTTIHTVTNAGLPATNKTAKTYSFSNTTAYKYFRFEITAIEWGGIGQLQDFHFIATVQEGGDSGDSDCEDFNSTNGTSSYSTGGTLPSGWHRIYGGSTETGGTVYDASATSPANMPHVVTASATTPGAPNSSNYISFYSSGSTSTYSYAIMPPVESGAVSHLSFKYKFESTSNGTLTYGAISGTDASTYTVLGTISSPSSNPGTIDVDLNTSQTTGKRIAFRWYKSSTWYTCGIDDVCIESTPTYITEIATVADWEAFCAAVNNGYNYSGKTVTMTANVGTVSTMCGTVTSGDNASPANCFSGIFDGQGHTLNVSISDNNQGAAPFRSINNATIKNLKVIGSVSHGNHHGSGLVGFAKDGSSNLIENCHVSANVTGTATNRYNGGIVGHVKKATVTLNGCIYDGQITSNESSNVGGLIGWGDSGHKVHLSDCLFNGTKSGSSSKFHPIGCCGGPSSSSSVTNCYYYATNSVSGQIADNDDNSIVKSTTGKGKRAYSITGQSVTVDNAGNATTYGGNNVTHYITGYGTGIKYNNVLYAGSGDQVSLTLGCSVPSGQELNGYTASNGGTLAASGNNYILTMPNNHSVINANITNIKIHIARNESSTQMTWDQFVTKVNGGTNYSGQTIYLDEDITISTQVGTSESICFKGIFDGQTHTLTLSGGTFGTSSSYNSNQYVAPFRNINGTTIQNLVVAGSLYTSAKFAAGVAAYAKGTNTITNCKVTAAINSSVNGDGTHGGIVAHVDGGTTTITGCVFNGQLLGSGTTYCGGIVGYTTSASYVRINHCIFDPTNVTFSSSNSNPICRNTSSSYINNCYYTSTALGTGLGKMRYTVTMGSGVSTMTMSGTATANNVSGITYYASNSGLLYNSTIIAGSGDQVSLTLGYAGTLDTGYAAVYSADHGTLSGSSNPYTLAMDAYNTIISATSEQMPLRVSDGTYLTWEQFCTNVDGGNAYSGKTVFLEKDISITTIVPGDTWASNGKRFSGTFDGQGNTITFNNYTATQNFTGLFRYTYGATIKNLRLEGTITSEYGNTASVIGMSQATNNVENVISNVTINSTATGVAGMIAGVSNSVYFRGCAFTGQLNGTSSEQNGGFVGRLWNNSTHSYTNCLFAPSSISSGLTGVATFDVYGSSSFTNCYYTQSFGTEQGKQAYTITGGTGITVELNGLTDTYTYSVSSIAGYSSSNKGMRYNGTILAGNGDNVSLTLTGASEYEADYGTLTSSGNSYTLAMPNRDVVISGLSCPVPTAFTYTALGSTYVTLTWTAGDQEDEWEVKYWANGDTEPADGQARSYSVTTDTITGLTLGVTYHAKVRAVCDAQNNEYSDWVQCDFTTSSKTFTNNSSFGDHNWSDPSNWNPIGVPTTDDDVTIAANVTIGNGVLAQAHNITNNATITIADGGQLWHNNTGVNLTIERAIAAYHQSNAQTNLGYKIISFPVSNLKPNSQYITGLLTSDPNHYDFYTFDYANQGEDDRYLEWMPVIAHYSNLGMDSYTGYLYASQEGTTIRVTGAVAPSSANSTYEFYEETGNEPFNGWYMVGNPFVCNAYLTANGGNLDFYEIEDYTQAGYAEFVLNDHTVAIPPMGGVMVRVHEDDYLVYSRTAPTNSKGGILNVDVNKVLSSKDGSAAETIDRARLRFGEGRNLEKLQLNPRHTKLYIPEGAKDYAVVYAEGAGSMPVNFKAENNESRFKLVFAASDVDGSSTSSETFAFYSNGAWVVNNEGDATLQVVDINGRILSTDRISGATTKAINAASGIYMLRLINGDNVKVQKIVVR